MLNSRMSAQVRFVVLLLWLLWPSEEAAARQELFDHDGATSAAHDEAGPLEDLRDSLTLISGRLERLSGVLPSKRFKSLHARATKLTSASKAEVEALEEGRFRTKLDRFESALKLYESLESLDSTLDEALSCRGLPLALGRLSARADVTDGTLRRRGRSTIKSTRRLVAQVRSTVKAVLAKESLIATKPERLPQPWAAPGASNWLEDPYQTRAEYIQAEGLRALARVVGDYLRRWDPNQKRRAESQKVLQFSLAALAEGLCSADCEVEDDVLMALFAEQYRPVEFRRFFATSLTLELSESARRYCQQRLDRLPRGLDNERSVPQERDAAVAQLAEARKDMQSACPQSVRRMQIMARASLYLSRQYRGWRPASLPKIK